MTILLATLENLLNVIWRISWQASVLALLIFALSLLVRLPARVRCILWMLVLLRLTLPALPQSRWSIFNLLGAAPAPIIQPLTTLAHAPEQGVRNEAAGAPALEVHWSSTSLHQRDIPTTLLPAPAEPALTPRAASLNRWQILAIVWSAGAMFMLSATFIASLRLRKMLRNFRPLQDRALQSLLASCTEELSIRREIPLCVSDSLDSPALVGLLSPRLVLPASLPANFSPAELRLVFLHELTHYKRCDIPLNYLLAILLAAHWFNPVLHLFFNRWHNDRELACDETVMARLEDPRSYGQTILKLLQTLAGPAGQPCRVWWEF